MRRCAYAMSLDISNNANAPISYSSCELIISGGPKGKACDKKFWMALPAGSVNYRQVSALSSPLINCDCYTPLTGSLTGISEFGWVIERCEHTTDTRDDPRRRASTIRNEYNAIGNDCELSPAAYPPKLIRRMPRNNAGHGREV
ncbi:hypothetical protein DBV15_11837 [Temnothorax longispinosus]|uniref:Uncharacterized protein n=1 Tax=Temnothorax longispinosus TaxID=300112 RepID=A0A4S2KFI9_9HYME|nr:hypothetical protein DBV15_11837 [Temnothorax longispinosus]